jgi:hypothetical protein
MTVYIQVSYDEQDDGQILKAARKQQYIMFPAPIAFLNVELKAELGMKTKKEEAEIEVQFCSLKVPLDAADKDSKTCTVKIRKYDMGSPEDFLKWRTTLNEQIKNNVFAGNYEMVMNLAQALLAERALDAFVKERRTHEVKNKTRLDREQLS